MKQRIIKFRAWDKQAKQMLIGHNQYGSGEPDSGLRKTSAGAFTRLWEALARFDEDDSFVLMQYTGLKDRNGKEIYEGDIVRWSESWLVSDSGEDEMFTRLVKWEGQILFPGNLERKEVIGNIYENPDLLKQ